MTSRAPISALLAAGLLLVPGPATALDRDDLEAQMLYQVHTYFADGFVHVGDTDSSGARVVVNAVPDPAPDEFLAQRMAEDMVRMLRDQALHPLAPGADFATGSQFVVLGRNNLVYEGAGEEMQPTLQRVGRQILDVATTAGLGVDMLRVSGRGSGMVLVYLVTKSVGLGTQRARATEAALPILVARRLASQLPGVVYLPEDSVFKVIDLIPPRGEQPRGDPGAQPAARPAPAAPPAAPVMADSGGDGEPEHGEIEPDMPFPELPQPPVDDFDFAAAPGDGGTGPVQPPAEDAWPSPGDLDGPGDAATPPPMSEGPAPPPTRLVVHFDSDQTTLGGGDRARLGEAASGLGGGDGDGLVVIVGHTDSRNSEAYNLELGMRRAVAVRDFFVGRGVDSSRITVESQGEAQPVAPNDSPANMARNRRAEVDMAAAPTGGDDPFDASVFP